MKANQSISNLSLKNDFLQRDRDLYFDGKSFDLYNWVRMGEASTECWANTTMLAEEIVKLEMLFDDAVYMNKKLHHENKNLKRDVMKAVSIDDLCCKNESVQHKDDQQHDINTLEKILARVIIKKEALLHDNLQLREDVDKL